MVTQITEQMMKALAEAIAPAILKDDRIADLEGELDDCRETIGILRHQILVAQMDRDLALCRLSTAQDQLRARSRQAVA